MNKNNQMILKEGYFKIAIALAIAIFLNLFICNFLGYIGYLITILLVYIYRNPKRHIYRNSKSILSPVDGTIEAIDKTNGKYKIYIRTSICDAQQIISPISGKLKIKKYFHGLNLNPNTPKALLLNEQISIKIDDIKIKFISGQFNTTIDKMKEQNLEQGDLIGLFINGIVVLTVKENHKLNVTISDKIKYGQAIINN
ncbi:MAG: phosphatidylserine decarboxylase [Campylobacterota bacterium]|nr:phosphatidylserine decarboxylase [Campylobacterota bacterium]